MEKKVYNDQRSRWNQSPMRGETHKRREVIRGFRGDQRKRVGTSLNDPLLHVCRRSSGGTQTYL